MSSRPRSSTYYADRDRDRIVTPGLSSYRPSTRYADVPRYMPTATTTSPRSSRTSPRYHDDTYTSSRSKPDYTTSSRPSTSDKGLSYTSTRDLGGWLGGAALTAGAAYLLRGGGSGSRDRGRSRERESRSSRRYHDDDRDYYSYREKSRRRGKSEGRGERRRSSRYYYD